MTTQVTTTQAKAATLEVEGLTVDLVTATRGDVRIVDDVSFTIMPSAMTALVGESGAGKSLSVKAILGLLDDRRFRVRGQVRLCGVDLSELSVRERRRHVASTASLVFQNPTRALNPTMRVGEQIIETFTKVKGAPKISKEEARERGVELLRAVGIPDPAERYHSYPHQLSGGMRQRIVIAIALSSDPKIILCDEPTSSLDVTTQALIMDLLDRLRRDREISILLITHDLALASSRVDDVMVLYGGRLVETHPARRILEQAAMPYTRDLLASVPDVADPDAFRRNRAHRRRRSAGARDGCMYAPTCTSAEDRCRNQVPPLAQLGPGHLCRCWFPVLSRDADPRHSDTFGG